MNTPLAYSLALIGSLTLQTFGCTCQEGETCDINNQLVFLGVGPEIVGKWEREEGAPGLFRTFEFDEKGHFIQSHFGCDSELWPLSPKETNASPTNWSYQCTTLAKHTIEPGYFRLEYHTNDAVDWIEGRLLQNGRLKMDSNIVFYYRGVFAKKAPEQPSETTDSEIDDRFR